MISNDTIAAISTPAGNGAISIIRMSGSDSFDVMRDIFSSSLPKPGRIKYGKISDRDRVIDDVVITCFKSPASYTGEDIVEISCHGNQFIARQILELLLRKVRIAEPGEFTQRAFLNGKMDLTQAEAVGDLLMAKTKVSQMAALDQLHGVLHKRINSIHKRLTDCRILLELEIDFSEQELPDIDIDSTIEELEDIRGKLAKLAESGDSGIIIRDGFRISLAGMPNVGKSSLFNAFLETERAIVTPVPGTTRDYIEEAVAIEGYLVRFFDTAGLRDSDDHVELIGMERSRQMIEESHCVFSVFDAEKLVNGVLLEDGFDNFGKPVVRIANKVDLITEDQKNILREQDYILCSTVTMEGFKELEEKIVTLISTGASEIHDGMLTNSRQISACYRALSSVEKSISALKAGLGFEFAAFDLKETCQALEEITGAISTDELLNMIFSNFCIGK